MKHSITNNIVKIESIGQNNKLLQVSFEFLSNKIIRIYRKKCKTDLIELFEVADNRNFSIYDNNDYVTIKYYDYELIVDKDLKIFLKKSGKLLTTIEFSLKEQNKETYYQTSFDLIGENDVFGLGDKMGPLSKKGYFYQTRNTDDPTHQDELYPALYKSVPYMLFSTNQNYFGTFFPSTFKYSFDIAKSDLNKTFVNLIMIFI
jgi:alpha-glucosidase (family GH31 glycosyl hydrolase)